MIDKPFFPLAVEGVPGVPGTGPTSPLLGRFLCAGPVNLMEATGAGSNQIAKINFTGPPGSASGIYFSLVPFLEKNGFKVRKVDESISVTPEHQQYYNMVVEQKRQLEGVIKTGLASAAAAVADASLVEHDLRKYKEILNYFREGALKDEKKRSEHSLRAMFIDQVDVHTGDGVSLRSIVQRWPTIIADFMKLISEDDTIEKVEARLKGISKAEAVILTTKNKLFIEWENMFKGAAMERYNHLKSLAESRRKTIDEYRSWLKPYIARFKSMRLGHESIENIVGTAGNPYELAGQASFYNAITLWVWKPFTPDEFRKPSVESDYEIPINDDFIVDEYIKSKETGLANDKYYPELVKDSGLTGEAKSMIKDIIGKDCWKDDNKLSKSAHYYFFFIIEIERTGGKIPGYEFEDITFVIKAYMISQNVMFVKQLELRLREKEIEKYFNQILGIGHEKAVETDYPDLTRKEEEKKEEPVFKIDLGLKKYTEELEKSMKGMNAFFKGIAGSANKLISGLKLPLMFAKQGPYVHDFNDTIAKFYLTPMGQDAFGPIKGFILEQMGVG